MTMDFNMAITIVNGLSMPNQLFTFNILIMNGMHEASIRADDQLIHKIANINTFYETFG